MLKLFANQLRQLSKSSNLLRSSIVGEQAAVVEVNKAVEEWRSRLQEAGVGDIDFNLKCIVAHVLNKKFNKLKCYETVNFNSEQLKEFQKLCEARCARMPLQYIVGEWDFMDLTLKTAPTVFIPRPETEEFVAKVIEKYKEYPKVKMLEVGCGSGAMSLAILKKLPQVTSTAIERSKLATVLAAENATLLGLADRFEVFNHTMAEDAYMPPVLKDEKYDLIISNPPYVRTEEFQHLQPEVVVYENLNALDGGKDGLDIARLVFNLASIHLKPKGKLWLELGSDHPPIVKTIMHLHYQGKLEFLSSYKDQYDQERFVEIQKP